VDQVKEKAYAAPAVHAPVEDGFHPAEGSRDHHDRVTLLEAQFGRMVGGLASPVAHGFDQGVGQHGRWCGAGQHIGHTRRRAHARQLFGGHLEAGE
jgi:hypothetical protein